MVTSRCGARGKERIAKGGKDDASAQREGLRGLGGTGLIRRMTRMLALR